MVDNSIDASGIVAQAVSDMDNAERLRLIEAEVVELREENRKLTIQRNALKEFASKLHSEREEQARFATHWHQSYLNLASILIDFKIKAKFAHIFTPRSILKQLDAWWTGSYHAS